MQLFLVFVKYKGFEGVIFKRNYFSIDYQIFCFLSIFK